MKSHVLKLPNEYSFEKVGIKGKKYLVSDLTNSVSVLIIETKKGHDTTILEKECDFIYFVLEGSGSFIINGISEKCQKGDLVVIPARNKFKYVGNLKMLLINNPAFYPEQEITL